MTKPHIFSDFDGTITEKDTLVFLATRIGGGERMVDAIGRLIGEGKLSLRDGIAEAGRRRGWRTFLPEFKFTTDNAAMIAMAGYYRYLRGDFSSLDVSPVARLEEL